MEYKNIKIDIENGIAILTINRPEVRNALDYLTWDEIREGMRELKHNEEVNVIILTGAGGKAFASGADINSLQKRTVVEQMNSEVNDILYEISNLNKPVIAAIDGYALGGGCELAMACDIRIATKKSKFGQPEVNLGIIPGGGGTQRLQRLVGIGMAKLLIFTGEIIPAEEAARIGLIEKVVEEVDILDSAMEIAEKIKAKGPLAITLAKMSINIGADTDLRTGLYFERYAQAVAFSSDDKAEGTAAFIEKREAHFKGR